MLIKVLKNCFTPSHSLKKGELVNMRSTDASKLIAKKLAKVPTKTELKKKEGEKDG